jgi:chromosome segregation ATPase
MRQALSDYETAFDRLQVAHDDLADRLAAAQQAIEMAQAEKIDVQSEIQVLASGTAVMANRIRELEEELGDARAQSRSVAAERLWNSGEVNELRSDLHMVKRQSEMNLGALNKAQAKLQEKETLVSLRESEVASVKGELQEMQVKIIGLQRAMVEKDRTIEMCRDKVASKQYELDEVVVKLDGLSKEKQGLEREVQELREEILVIKVRGDEGWAEQRDEVS